MNNDQQPSKENGNGSHCGVKGENGRHERMPDYTPLYVRATGISAAHQYFGRCQDKISQKMVDV